MVFFEFEKGVSNRWFAGDNYKNDDDLNNDGELSSRYILTVVAS